MSTEHIHHYYGLGWSLIPTLRLPKKKPPAVESWADYQTDRATLEEIEKWAESYNMAVVTGQLSGVVVIDVDDINVIDDFNDKYGNVLDVSKSNVAKTGRGGYHFYFKHPGYHVKTIAGLETSVDIRGDGGYVVVPGSVHHNGTKYEWVSEVPSNFPDFPDSIFNAIDDRKVEVASGDSIHQGERDEKLTVLIGSLFKRKYDKKQTMAMAWAYNLAYVKPPLPQKEVEKIVNSIGKKEGAKELIDFDIKSFSEMVDLYADFEQEWLIDQWLPESTCGLIVSMPGMYKTWVMIDLLLSIATGKQFLNKYAPNRTGPVVLVQQEDPFPMIMDRFAHAMNVGEVSVEGDDISFTEALSNLPIYFHTTRSLHFDNDDIVDKFIERIYQINPALVVIDPLYTAASTDDYMAKAASKMMFMKTVRDDLGTGFLITHHSGKNSKTERERDALWGSQFLNAWLETGWQFNPGTNPFEVQITRNFKIGQNPPPTNVIMQIEKGKLQSIIDGGTVQLSDEEQQIIEAVSTLDISSLSDLAKAAGLENKQQADRLCKKLNISKVDGYYRYGV